MKCKEFRDMIITDYIDDELDRETRNLVEAHISVCEACRDYKENLLRASIKPFQNLTANAVPGEVWLNLRERLAERKAAGAKSWFRLPRIAFVSAAAAGLLIATFAIFKPAAVKEEAVQVFAQASPYNEQNFYLTSSHQPTQNSEESFGTVVEDCLL
jgi:anti-sigma factor RsiW